jgi:hypothetical protein
MRGADWRDHVDAALEMCVSLHILPDSFLILVEWQTVGLFLHDTATDDAHCRDNTRSIYYLIPQPQFRPRGRRNCGASE